MLDLLEKKIMRSHGSLTGKTNSDLYGLKKRVWLVSRIDQLINFVF